MTPNETARATAGAGTRFLPAAPARRLLLLRSSDHGGDLTALAQVLRLDRSTLYRVLGRDRLRYDTADRIAVCLGRHPSELWPEWFRCTSHHDVAPCAGPDLQERHSATQKGKGPFRLIIPRS